jgi:hypothetical protein
MEGGFFASLQLYISIAKRTSLTILPDVHMYKAVPSNFRVVFMGSFPTKKCGDGNWCSVGVQGEEGCCFGFFFFLSIKIKPGVPYIQTKWNKSWTGNSKIEKVMTCHPFVIKKKKKPKQHPSSPWTPTEHRFPSPHFFIGKTAHKCNPEIWWYCLIHMHIG